MNILLIAERTSGHMTNLLSIYQELLKRNYNPIFVINNSKNEQDFVDYNKINFYKYTNLIEFKNILTKLNPKCLISSGGKFSFKIVNLAKIMNIPCYLLEPNYYPGLTNLINSIDSTVLSPCSNYSNLYAGKIIKYDNPIRINHGKKLEINTDKKYKLFISAGTNGVFELNKFILKNIKILEDNDIFVIWQTGINKIIDYKSNNTMIKPYFNDIHSIYNISDLVITTGGVNTLQELIQYNIPIISIPSNYTKFDHHIHNVIALKNYIEKVIFIEEMDDPNLIYHIINILKKEKEEKKEKDNKKTLYNNELYNLINQQPENNQHFSIVRLFKIVFISIFLYSRSIIFYNYQKRITKIKKLLGINYVNFEEIDPLFTKIMIICEDHTFYAHSGFYPNTIRFVSYLFIQIIFGKRLIFSGIYQQIIKNLYFEKSNSNLYNGYRKFMEYLMTPILNNIYSKNMIIEYYFNILSFIDYKSNQFKFFGIKMICKEVFNKDLKQLNILEKILIGTTLKDPIFYYPYLKKKIVHKEVLNKITKIDYLLNNKEYSDFIKIEISKYQIID